MSFMARIITLLPDAFPGSLGQSLAGRALREGIWSLDTFDLRNFGVGKHHSVDDTPAGGGAGMVIRADVAGEAIETACKGYEHLPLLALSPRGKPLTQSMAKELSQEEGVVLFSSRFEGVDERIFEHYPIKEVSIGDYILSGGDNAALVLLDAVIRLLPNVMGTSESEKEESFENDGLLEYPHYTRPALWKGCKIPEVLLSGDHKRIGSWRQEQAESLTCQRRPDLWQYYQNKKDDK